MPLGAATHAELAALGIRDFAGLVPDDLLSWSALVTLASAIAGAWAYGWARPYLPH